MTLQVLSLSRLLKSTCLMLVVLGVVLTAAQAQRVYQYLSLLDWSAQFTLLTLGTIGLAEVLLPAATFLAVLYVFRAAWRRGYVSTLFSCGYSPWRLNSADRHHHGVYRTVLTLFRSNGAQSVKGRLCRCISSR